MRLVYTTLLYLATPGVLARLAWRGLRAPAYWRRWPERFGFLKVFSTQDRLSQRIWVHAVSVGEAVAAAPLVRALRARYPNLPLVVTTTTTTGSQRVRTLFGQDVLHSYAPYDLPGAVERFLDRARPRVAVIMETELWPNLFHHSCRRGIPVIVANARLSERSARGYRRVGPLIAKTLRCTAMIAAQGQADADRFIHLGADPARVCVTGNIKFDLKLPASVTEQAQVLREQWGRDRPVWIAASTHEGEDEQVLEAFATIKQSSPACLLVLVPRHPERFARVATLCRRRGLRTVLRSEQSEAPDPPLAPGTDVFLGDTMGELPLFYAASDVAFVGGSLVPTGGHNPLEPAALGRPILVGPYTFNFQEISELFLTASAALRVNNAGELAQQVQYLLQHAAQRSATGERAQRVVEQNRGALKRLMAIISGYLDG